LPSGDVVSINNVTWGYSSTNTYAAYPDSLATARNPKYYVPVYDQAPEMEYDGRTVVLTAAADVEIGHTYHLKLAVTNVGDNAYGSGVFLRGGSLDLGQTITNHGSDVEGMDNIYEGCNNNRLAIFTGLSSSPKTITLAYSGNGVGSIVQPNNSPMPTSITVPAGNASWDVPYKVIGNVPIDGASITISTHLQGCPTETSKTIYVYKQFTNPQVTATNDCGGGGTLSVQVTGGHNPQMSLDGTNWQPISNPFTGLAKGTYSVLVRDSVSCTTHTLSGVVRDCYSLAPENATVQEYQSVVIDELANDALPGTVFTPTFDLLSTVSLQPLAGSLSVIGSGSASKLVYTNNGVG
jgi:hypothetical protein